MSTSLNSKASLTKLATTQRTTTQCSSSFKVFPRVSGKRSLKTQLSKCMTKWRRKQSVSWPLNASSMPCTSNPHEMLLPSPTSRQTGKPEDNNSKAIRVNSRNNKGLARPPSTPLQHQDHGIINQCNWPGGMVRHRTPISSRTGCAVIVEHFMSLMEFHVLDIVEKTLVTVHHSGATPVW